MFCEALVIAHTFAILGPYDRFAIVLLSQPFCGDERIANYNHAVTMGNVAKNVVSLI